MEEKILNIIEEICGTDEIREDKDMNLFDSGFMDSLAMTELLIKIEEVFGIEIAPTEVVREDMDTVNKISNFLCTRVKNE